MGKALLADETKFFEENEAQFRKQHKNRFLLIHGHELIGAYQEEEEAVVKGVQEFGSDPFLVRKPGDAELVFDAPAYSLGLLHANT